MKKIKGVITAGGLGTRLYPMTRVTNKHLLPVYDRPMIFYPIESLVQAGIEDIMVITGGNHAGDFLPLLGNGSEFGLRSMNYTYQSKPGGIAEALSLTREFIGDDHVVVILGDNILQYSIRRYVDDYRKQGQGAKILLSTVEHPEHYGVPQFEGDRLVDIVEKPKNPPSQFAVIGVYMYDNRVFDMIKHLEPSKRGELEITDVNKAYLKEGTLTYSMVSGWWADCGETRSSLHESGSLIAQTGANNEFDFQLEEVSVAEPCISSSIA